MNKFNMYLNISRMILRHEPLYLIFALPRVVLSSALPLLYVYFPKLFIEKMIAGETYENIVQTILIYISILVIVNVANSFFSNRIGFYAERFSKKLREETGSITMKLLIENMEMPSFRNKLFLANNVQQITKAIDILQKILSEVITVIGLGVIIVQLDYIFILIVTATLVIKGLFVFYTYQYNKKQRILHAKNDRVGNYLNSTAYFNEGAAKELRINNLQSWFMGKIKEYRNEMLRIQYCDFKLSALFESITVIIMSIQAFLVLYILSLRYINGFINIADFTMYFSAVTAITVALSSIAEQIGEFNRQYLYISDFDDLKKIYVNDEVHVKHNISNYDIVFKDVSFYYPNTNRIVLDNINLRIKNGQKLSIVGHNGAGKTTFVKLLCKFYRPTNGTITIGGVDIWSIGKEEFNNLIAVVFQDFVNFDFTVGENVSMSEDYDKEKITTLLNEAGLKNLLSRLPDGVDTYLSRSFDDNGVELSGGEGQKLAIARAMHKNTPILILDEPTASLDPKAENEIYDSFFKISKSKTTIFISHRLAASTYADKIAVFEDGKIVEYGSHTELLSMNKSYANMFRMQSKAYKE